MKKPSPSKKLNILYDGRIIHHQITEEEALSILLELAEQSYKDEIEGAQKDEIIAKYSILLDEETMKTFVEGEDTYEVVTLKKELAFIAMEKNPNVFTQNNDNAPGFIPTGGSDDHLSEATKLIMKHRKKQ